MFTDTVSVIGAYAEFSQARMHPYKIDKAQSVGLTLNERNNICKYNNCGIINALGEVHDVTESMVTIRSPCCGLCNAVPLYVCRTHKNVTLYRIFINVYTKK